MSLELRLQGATTLIHTGSETGHTPELIWMYQQREIFLSLNEAEISSIADGYVAVDVKFCRYILLPARLCPVFGSTVTREMVLPDFRIECYQKLLALYGIQ
jgi:hypothetical protein